MTTQRMEDLLAFYSKELLENTMPFWMKHAPDYEYGGYITAVARNGEPLSRHKSVWIHGRFIWMLSTLYTQLEPRQEWLDLATHGMQFLDKYGFDAKGKMYFTLDRDGQPVRMRRYVFSEVFAVMAYAAYYRATKNRYYLDKAHQIYTSIRDHIENPELQKPKYEPVFSCTLFYHG